MNNFVIKRDLAKIQQNNKMIIIIYFYFNHVDVQFLILSNTILILLKLLVCILI